MPRELRRMIPIFAFSSLLTPFYNADDHDGRK
jgi:hypothetical protein